MNKVKSLVRPIICRLDTSNCHDDFSRSFNNHRECVNQTLRLILPYVIKYPQLVTTFGIRDAIQYKRAKNCTIPSTELDLLFNRFNHICDSLDISKKRIIRRDICTVVNDMYLSVKRRHKKNVIVAPQVKNNKCIRSNEGQYKLINQNGKWFLSLELLEKTPLVVPIEVLNTNMTPFLGKNYKIGVGYEDKKTYGGVIEYNNKSDCFIAKLVCRIDFDEKYIPVSSLGIDINKRQDTYIAMSDDSVVSRPEKIEKLVNEILDANDKISKATNTKTRSLARKRWINKQKSLKSEVCKIVPDILDKVCQSKSLLCIDGAKPGAGCGEYGQVLSSILRSECERQRIPHIWVDSYHTSTTCRICGYRDKKNRKSESEFCCKKCNHTEDADIHAAKYIADLGFSVYKSS